MKAKIASCPSCGSPVEFRVSSSLVTICEFCNCVVARTDKAIEDHGKVADLVQTNSPLQLGVTGKYRGRKFELIGRVQYKHPAGGVWDEWYLAFSNGKWGWLAEAQGKFYLTFEKRISKSIEIPPLESLVPGKEVKFGSNEPATVAEIGEATTGAAAGEIPWDFEPGIPHRFADLYGPKQIFITLDYSDTEPKFFLGKEVELKDLELAEGWGMDGGGTGLPSGQRVEAVSVNCPQCAGPLSLHAPDETQRVACPSCNSLLDCNHGKLEYLQTLTKVRRVRPLIPLGTIGKLREKDFTVIGFMERFVRYQGQTYPWTEYLLYNQDVGFRWLTHNDRHWAFVEPVSVAEAKKEGQFVTYNGETYRLYDKATAFVRYVIGEFYWKVTTGEQVNMSDFICPPRMLSFERTDDGTNKEVNVSLSTYLTTEEVQEAFKVENLMRPFGVGMIQPKPRQPGVYQLWGMFLLLLLVLYAIVPSITSKSIDGGFFVIMLIVMSVLPVGTFVYQHNFEVQRWRNSDYSPYNSE